MGELINLNRARKQATRTNQRKTAENNRVAFGRTKEERLLILKEQKSAIRHIEGHRLEPKNNNDTNTD